MMHTPVSLPAEEINGRKERVIRVKFVARGMQPAKSKKRWARQLPGSGSRWGGCRFTFDINSRDYDWLVVYHDLPRQPMSLCTEKLCCPREKTILITTEPSSITVYGTDYLRQFGLIITSQEPWK